MKHGQIIFSVRLLVECFKDREAFSLDDVWKMLELGREDEPEAYEGVCRHDVSITLCRLRRMGELQVVGLRGRNQNIYLRTDRYRILWFRWNHERDGIDSWTAPMQ